MLSQYKPFDPKRAIAGEKVLWIRNGEPELSLTIAEVLPTKDGRYVVIQPDLTFLTTVNEKGEVSDSQYKLVMAPKPTVKVQLWASLFKSITGCYYIGGVAKTYNEACVAAQSMNNDNYICTKQIEWDVPEDKA